MQLYQITGTIIVDLHPTMEAQAIADGQTPGDVEIDEFLRCRDEATAATLVLEREERQARATYYINGVSWAEPPLVEAVAEAELMKVSGVMDLFEYAGLEVAA